MYWFDGTGDISGTKIETFAGNSIVSPLRTKIDTFRGLDPERFANRLEYFGVSHSDNKFFGVMLNWGVVFANVLSNDQLTSVVVVGKAFSNQERPICKVL